MFSPTPVRESPGPTVRNLHTPPMFILAADATSARITPVSSRTPSCGSDSLQQPHAVSSVNGGPSSSYFCPPRVAFTLSNEVEAEQSRAVNRTANDLAPNRNDHPRHWSPRRSLRDLEMEEQRRMAPTVQKDATGTLSLVSPHLGRQLPSSSTNAAVKASSRGIDGSFHSNCTNTAVLDRLRSSPCVQKIHQLFALAARSSRLDTPDAHWGESDTVVASLPCVFLMIRWLRLCVAWEDVWGVVTRCCGNIDRHADSDVNHTITRDAFTSIMIILVDAHIKVCGMSAVVGASSRGGTGGEKTFSSFADDPVALGRPAQHASDHERPLATTVHDANHTLVGAFVDRVLPAGSPLLSHQQEDADDGSFSKFVSRVSSPQFNLVPLPVILSESIFEVFLAYSKSLVLLHDALRHAGVVDTESLAIAVSHLCQNAKYVRVVQLAKQQYPLTFESEVLNYPRMCERLTVVAGLLEYADERGFKVHVDHVSPTALRRHLLTLLEAAFGNSLTAHGVVERRLSGAVERLLAERQVKLAELGVQLEDHVRCVYLYYCCAGDLGGTGLMSLKKFQRFVRDLGIGTGPEEARYVDDIFMVVKQQARRLDAQRYPPEGSAEWKACAPVEFELSFALFSRAVEALGALLYGHGKDSFVKLVSERFGSNVGAVAPELLLDANFLHRDPTTAEAAVLDPEGIASSLLECQPLVDAFFSAFASGEWGGTQAMLARDIERWVQDGELVPVFLSRGDIFRLIRSIGSTEALPYNMRVVGLTLGGFKRLLVLICRVGRGFMGRSRAMPFSDRLKVLLDRIGCSSEKLLAARARKHGCKTASTGNCSNNKSSSSSSSNGGGGAFSFGSFSRPRPAPRASTPTSIKAAIQRGYRQSAATLEAEGTSTGMASQMRSPHTSANVSFGTHAAASASFRCHSRGASPPRASVYFGGRSLPQPLENGMAITSMYGASPSGQSGEQAEPLADVVPTSSRILSPPVSARALPVSPALR